MGGVRGGAEPVRSRRRRWKAFVVRERALRNPPACVGVERAEGRPGNSGEPSRPRRLRDWREAMPALPGSGRGGRAAVGAGRRYSEVGKAGRMGKGPRFIDARVGAEGFDEWRIG